MDFHTACCKLFRRVRFYGLSAATDPVFHGGFSYKQQEQSSGLDESSSGDSSGDLRLHGGGTGFKFLSGRQGFPGFL